MKIPKTVTAITAPTLDTKIVVVVNKYGALHHQLRHRTNFKTLVRQNLKIFGKNGN